jgi:hypothetical protein
MITVCSIAMRHPPRPRLLACSTMAFLVKLELLRCSEEIIEDDILYRHHFKSITVHLERKM